MDERLREIEHEVDAGTVSPQSLVLLFNAASDAEHLGDLAALEKIFALARSVASAADETLRPEADRLVALCEQSLLTVRDQYEASKIQPTAESLCPECGNEVPPNAIRCRRCGHRFI
jgi:ribosomal protein L40E